MPKIFFPSEYKKSIVGRNKTMTIRIGKEAGKYKIDSVYSAYSYAGADWQRKIKITEIKKFRIKDLEKSGITRKTINYLLKNYSLKKSDIVQIIRFQYL